LSPILSVDDLGTIEFRRPTMELDFTVASSSSCSESSSPSCDSLPEINVSSPPPNPAVYVCNEISQDDRLSSAQKQQENQAECSTQEIPASSEGLSCSDGQTPDKPAHTGQPDDQRVLANWRYDTCPLLVHCKLIPRWMCMTLAFGLVCVACSRLKTFRPRLLLNE